MATVSTRPGCAGRDPGTPRSRGGASARVNVSVSGSEWRAGLTVTLMVPAGPGSLPRAPLLPRLPPRPARPLLTAPAARRLYRGPLPPPPPPSPARCSRSPPSTHPPTSPPPARSDYCGERPGKPCGEPRNPRSPPRRRPRAGGVRAPLLQPRARL